MSEGIRAKATGHELRSGVASKAGATAYLAGPKRVERIIHILFNHERYAGKLVTLSGDGGEYRSRPITLVSNAARGIRKWVASFEEHHIPPGKYRLTVPVKTAVGDEYAWDLEIDYTFENVDNGDGKPVGGGGRRAKFEMQVGDAYSLEEALLRQFGNKYGHLSAQLLDESGKEGLPGHSPIRRNFATYINVADDMNSAVKSALGWVGQDNSYFTLLGELYGNSSYGKMAEALEDIRIFGSDPGPTLVVRGRLVADTPNNRLKHAVDSANGWGPYKFAGVVLDWYAFGNKITTLFEAYSKMPEADVALGEFVRQYDRTNRHAMIKAEALRVQTDLLAASAAEEGLRFSYTTAWMGIGLLFSGPAFELADAAIDVVKEALSALDHCLFDEALGNNWRRLIEAWGEFAAMANNDVDMKYALIAGDRASTLIARKLNMRLRAKALYHLMQLIDRCGSYERNPAQFSARTRTLRIGAYIDEFILRREWWIRVDVIWENWLSLYWDEEDAATRQRFISTRRPSGAHGQQWFRVNFQEQFPIHLMDHDSALSLARDFSQDYGGITADDVERTFWQWGRNKGTAEKPDWNWTDLKAGDEIGSEVPVRAVVLLREKSKVRWGYPAEVTLHRVDGVNAEGPKETGAIRPVTAVDKLTGLEGRKAAILPFSYSYKFHVYQGLKPLKSWWHSVIPQTMHMAAYYRLGDNDLQGWLDDGCEIRMTFWSHEPGKRAESAMNVRNVRKFGDLKFLERRSQSEGQKFPVDPRWLDRIIVQKQVGSSWRDLEADESVKAESGLRVVVLFKPNARLRPGTPVSVRVRRTDGGNVDGPEYRTNVIVAQQEFDGKLGAIVSLYYWRFVTEYNDGDETWEQDRTLGVKPVALWNHGRIELAGYTFDLLVSVGDGIDMKPAEPDDIPLEFSADQMAAYSDPHARFVNDDKRTHIKAVMWRVGFPGTMWHGSDAFYDSLRPRLESGELGEDVANEIERPKM